MDSAITLPTHKLTMYRLIVESLFAYINDDRNENDAKNYVRYKLIEEYLCVSNNCGFGKPPVGLSKLSYLDVCEIRSFVENYLNDKYEEICNEWKALAKFNLTPCPTQTISKSESKCLLLKKELDACKEKHVALITEILQKLDKINQLRGQFEELFSQHSDFLLSSHELKSLNKQALIEKITYSILTETSSSCDAFIEALGLIQQEEQELKKEILSLEEKKKQYSLVDNKEFETILAQYNAYDVKIELLKKAKNMNLH